jgi:hypothetical protein
MILLPSPHPASLDEAALLAQCEVGRGRAPGPGGQHRNKVETKVMITHTVTGVHAQASERRSQEQNRSEAVQRLRLALAVEVRTEVPLGEVRTDLWRSRCDGDGHIACNPDHHDYPTLLALALDVITAAGWDVKKASLRLCCTMSQLVKLMKDHPPALVMVNKERALRKMHGLK